MPETQVKATKEEPDLYRLSIKSGYWVIATQASSQMLGFIKTFLTAWLFLLEDLGIVGAALLLLDVLNTFTQTGFETALIQKKGEIRDYLDTAWTAGVLKGIGLFVIMYVSAPWIAQLRVPADKVTLAIAVFRTMAVCFLLQGFRNIGAIYFNKDFQFHKIFILSVGSTLAEVIVLVILALTLRTIWSVVIARVVCVTLSTAGSYLLSEVRPRLHFAVSKARELWKYGRWIFGQNVLGYLLETGDDFFVWFYLGVSPLAVYQYAYRFANAPFMWINSLYLQVLFPAYSKVQDDMARLRAAYFKVVRISAAIAVPLSLLVFSLGPDFVRLFLPERLHPMIPVLQILAFKGLLKSLGSTRVPFFQAVGKPQILLFLMWLRVSILCATIYFLTRTWGIVGTAVSVTLVNVLADPIALFIMSNRYKIGILDTIKQSLLPFAAGVLMVASLLGAKYLLGRDFGYVTFFALSTAGAVIYLIGLIGLDRLKSCGYSELLLEQFDLLKGVVLKAKRAGVS
ncbi:MAG: lipopolysaccharide biosynthesis protein [Planctomycetaceae bacterium]|nr:lipopolysaccharide biosynthesis protein [Planctomycetaceae bacterium]